MTQPIKQPAAPEVLRAGSHQISLAKPLLMAILNITPDSFSDGGLLFGHASALDSVWHRAEEIIAQGGDLFDVGGESTRPGAAVVSEQQELDRVIPVVEGLVERFELPVSIDTSTPAVIRAAAMAGAALHNDVRSLRRPGALEALCETDMAVCLMHMQGEPESMQSNPEYHDVCAEVGAYLSAQADRVLAAGVRADRVVLDPGFGFGKALEHNLQLLNGLGALKKLGFPVLVGMSRKSMIGSILSSCGHPRPVNERVHGGVALATLAAASGANIIRTHDVAATSDALRIVDAAQNAIREENV